MKSENTQELIQVDVHNKSFKNLIGIHELIQELLEHMKSIYSRTHEVMNIGFSRTHELHIKELTHELTQLTHSFKIIVTQELTDSRPYLCKNSLT